MHGANNLLELAKDLTFHDQQKQDWVIPARSLSLGQDSYLLQSQAENGPPPVVLKDVARAQLLTRTGIPSTYADRCVARNRPDIIAWNTNQWLQDDEGSVLVRTYNSTVGRAILSDSYRPLDNYDLMQAILPVVEDLAPKIDLECVSAQVTDRRLYLRLVSRSQTIEPRVGDIIQNGIVISNSETGHGAVSLRRFTLVLRCLNGAVMEHAFRKTHLGRQLEAEGFYSKTSRMLEDAAFWSKLSDAMRWVFDEQEFQDSMAPTIEAASLPLPKPTEAVQIVTRRYGLPKSSIEDLTNKLITSGDSTAYGLVNAVTALAHELDPDSAFDMQKVGGQLMALTPPEWNTLLRG